MTPEKTKSFKSKVLDNIGFRLTIICILVLFLNIPLSMVSGVIYSRVYLFEDTVNEISSDWGGEQTIIAPIIKLPVKFTYLESAYNDKRKVYEKVTSQYTQNYYLLPENLNIDAKITPEQRHRGIFDVLVHTTKVNITGNFEPLDTSSFEYKHEVLWNKASLIIGINPSLIRGDMQVTFDGRELSLNPGSGMDNLTGISADLNLSKGLDKSFNLAFQFNGSRNVSFAPLGKKNTFNAESKWAHPIFSNTFRPDAPEISDQGFKASWKIPYIARNYPQMFDNMSIVPLLKENLASVGLYDTMPIYKKSSRLAEYGIMFITLTFIMMFLFERKLKQNLHYVQYGIIGLAVSLFFLTTLSFSEYMSFCLAYTIASAIVIGMITAYIYAALKNGKTALTGAALMTVLYGILYMMLSDGNYSLLIGTFILLFTMAAVMWATRNINAPTSAKQ